MKKYVSFLLIFFCALLLTGCSIGKYAGLTAEEWADEAYYCESRLEDFSSALEEANNNIEDAQTYAGSSYDDMEWALYNLSTVSEP